jgi:uncharacterized protein YdcH (DUF465 family)
MTRIDWLKKKHSEIDANVQALEHQRSKIRSPEHKAVLQDLKKQKLAIKTELELALATQYVPE